MTRRPGAVRAMLAKYRLAMSAPRTTRGFESRWTPVRGMRMHHRASLTAPAGSLPVVLVHGLAVSHRYMMPTAERLADRYQVHAVDLPGFGLSEDPGSVLDVPELADYLADWLVATGLGPAALLGNSFGCQVAVDLAARYPDRVRCLVLAGPTMDPAARSKVRQFLRWLRDLGHEDPLQIPILLRDVWDASPRRAALTFHYAVHDPIERKLPAVGVPTLVTRGSVEPIVPQRWAELATRLLPLGKLAVLPGGPHCSNYTAADGLAGLAVPFLERVAAGEPTW